MTDQEKELRMRISMLMDADLDGRDNPRLIEKLEEDAELQATWARYNLIGDVMRSTGAPLASPDFAAKISAAIADEPTVLAPKTFKNTNVVRPRVVSWALAASLAVAAVLVGKSVNEHSDVFQMASNAAPKAQVASKEAELAQNQAESQFNDYLVMHSETSYMAGSAGMLPHVRLVGSRPADH
jgi:sigma-E factor negative regulatory protein RseA